MWAGLLTAAKEYEDKPIVFIAVNSGNPRSLVEDYVKQNGITWPVLVDTDRQFEKQANVTEISLKNIHQARIITNDGTLQRVSLDDVDDGAGKALQGARWKVDPSEVPPGLDNVWRECEYGELTPSEAAADFESAVLAAMEQDVSRFWKLGKQRELADAYRTLVAMHKRFAGYELPEDVRSAGRWLESRPELREVVAQERAKAIAQEKEAERKAEAERRSQLANRALRTAERLIASSDADEKDRGSDVLKRIIKQYPETEAAKKAQEMLDANQAG